MKIKFKNNSELEKCKKLLDVKEANICAAEIYIEYLNNHYNDISKTTNFYKSFLNCLEIDEDDNEYQQIEQICNISKIDKLDECIFKNNEFYQTFINSNDRQKDCALMNLYYEPFEGFVYDELEIEENYFSEKTPFGYFDSKFSFPAVIKEDLIWMSVIPHEINTMKDAIKNAKGNVLVLGLGLGYYLFNILKKDDVKHVDVIELDKNVIDLFEKNIQPKLINKEKASIIFGDGIDYIKKCQQKYDYVFVDIWHNVGDGLGLYLKIKPLEKLISNAKFDYWIERSILAMLRRQLLTVFDEQLNGSKLDDYLKARNENDKIINKLYFLTQNVQISSYEDLHNILTENYLRNLATKF